MVRNIFYFVLCFSAAVSSCTYTQADAAESSHQHNKNNFSAPYGDRQDAELISTVVGNSWTALLSVVGLAGVTYAVIKFVHQHFSKQSTPPTQYGAADRVDQ